MRSPLAREMVSAVEDGWRERGICTRAALTLIYISRNTAARRGRGHGMMGCIDCEVPAAVTGGRGGERTLERGRQKEKAREDIWRSADYVEQNQQLVEKA